MDIKNIFRAHAKEGFSDEGFLGNFAKEKREIIDNVTIIFAKGCESEFDYF